MNFAKFYFLWGLQKVVKKISVLNFFLFFFTWSCPQWWHANTYSYGVIYGLIKFIYRYQEKTLNKIWTDELNLHEHNCANLSSVPRGVWTCQAKQVAIRIAKHVCIFFFLWNYCIFVNTEHDLTIFNGWKAHTSFYLVLLVKWERKSRYESLIYSWIYEFRSS